MAVADVDYETLRRENADLVARNKDLADALARAGEAAKAKSSWSDSAISLMEWVGANKAAIGVTLLYFYAGYREAFPKAAAPDAAIERRIEQLDEKVKDHKAQPQMEQLPAPKGAEKAKAVPLEGK